MTQIFKHLLVTMAATLLVTGVTRTESSAQVTIASVGDIPRETSGNAQAYYESATGDVYFSLGPDLLIAGIFGIDDQLLFENFR